MAAVTISATSRYTYDELKDKTEDQLLDWSKANKAQWAKVRDAIGATDNDTLEELSEIAPEDYGDKVHELTVQDQLKPM